MEQKNFEYLKEQLKYTGFGDALEAQLKENLEKKESEFTLRHHQEFGKDEATAVLHFKKSKEQNNYFFNSYDLSIKIGDQELKQSFYINAPKEIAVKNSEDQNDEAPKEWINTNITLKEAYNLLSGRAINKDLVNSEGQRYNTWLQLDFKDTQANGNYKKQYYNEAYGYDLKKVLSSYPIKELGNPDENDSLIASLQKGNRQSATFLLDGKEEKRFIEACPKFKSINIYDASNQRVKQTAKEVQTESVGKTKNLKQGEQADTEDPSRSNKKSKGRKQHLQ